MLSILLHGLVVALYAGLAWHFWRTRWKNERALESASHQRLSSNALGFQWWERALLTAAVALHAVLLADAVLGSGQFRFGFAHALSMMALLALVFYGIESLIHRLEGMPALVLPPAAVSVALPALFDGAALTAQAQAPAFVAHVLIAMLAYAFFAIAAAHAVLMMVVERRLHRRRGDGRAAAVLGGLAGPPGLGGTAGPGGSMGIPPMGMPPMGVPPLGMPPLLTMERLLFQMLAAGFVLLTLTLASGIVFSDEIFGRALRLDHKTVFGILAWLIFAVLLLGRAVYGWRGRTALKGTFAGFAALLLAYVGSRFVVEVVLGRV